MSARGRDLLPVEEALERILREAAPLGVETIALEAALGRTLAEAVIAEQDSPSVDRSAMDGYAVRSADVTGAPVELRVVGFLPAGASAEGIAVDQGAAVRIMTGAPLPAGADAVQKVEDTEGQGDGRRVKILKPVPAGEHILRRGSDLASGEEILPPGSYLRPAEIGALAAAGRARVTARRRPRAAVLSTGDEVVPYEEAPAPHQVRNSNAPTLLALLERYGAEPRGLGIARDDPAELDAKISQGLDEDVLLLIGGVSVGDRDYVAERLAASGVSVIFHRVAMKPGKPLLFGRRGGCLVFGLPGNPLSSYTDFLVFVLPALRRLSGLRGGGLPEVEARLLQEVRQKPGRTWYRPARVTLESGAFVAAPVRSSGSGDLYSATRANGFVIVPRDAGLLPAGERVRALLWPDFDLSTAR